MKGILIQHVYPGHGMEKLLQLTYQRHRHYALRHGLVYQSVIADVRFGFEDAEGQTIGDWDKVVLIRDAMNLGFENIVWLDADAYIQDLDCEITSVCKYGYVGAVEFPAFAGAPTHWNVGALYTGEGAWDIIEAWLAQFPGPEMWREQAVFNAFTDAEVNTLPVEWNYTPPRHPQGLDCYVRGFHNVRGVEEKYQAMQEALNEL
jgi:hypothetical protein